MKLFPFLSRLSQSALSKAYFTSILGVISGLLTQLIFIKTLTEKISSSQFSLYGFIFQIVSYLTIFQLGIDFATSREISLNLGKGNRFAANYAYWFIRRFNASIIAVVVFVIAAVAFFFYNGWGLQKEYNNLSGVLLVLLFGFSQVITFSIIPNIAALIGSNLQYIANLDNVVVSILSTLLGYVLLLGGAGVYSLPIALIFWGLCNIFFLRRTVKKKCDWLDNPPVKKEKDIERKTIKYSIATTLGGLAWTIEATSDVIILNAAGLLHMVAIYVIWWRFPQMLFDLVTRFTTSATPGFAHAHGRSEEQSRKFFQKVFLMVVGGGVIVFVGIILWLPSFVQIWITNSQYYYAGYRNLSILMSLLVFIRIIGNCLGMYLISIGNVRITTNLSWIQAIVKVLCSIALVKYFSLEGIFLASIITAFLQAFVLLGYAFAHKIIPIKMIIWVCFLIIISSGSIFYTPTETNFFFFLVKILFTALLMAIIWLVSINMFGYWKLLGFKPKKII
jgi:O-antigen/teichoic acid export membrane protein